MNLAILPPAALAALVQEALQRDRATARRVCLLSILWRERYLTRLQLVARVEALLGRGCFGSRAWDDTFYRDMRTVKEAFRAAGYTLAYSRSLSRPGYFLLHQPVLGVDLEKAIAGSIAEVDPAQIAIIHKRSPAERFQMGNSISNTAREVVAHRLRLRQPHISVQESKRLALQQWGLDGR
jgi:hypothetical protein